MFPLKMCALAKLRSIWLECSHGQFDVMHAHGSWSVARNLVARVLLLGMVSSTMYWIEKRS